MMSSTRGCPRGRLVRVAPVVRSSESIAAEGGPLDPTRILRSPLTWGVVATCSQRNKGGSGKSAQLGTPAQPQYWYEATLAASSSPSDTAQTDGTVAGDTLGDAVSAAPVARAVAATSQPTATDAATPPKSALKTGGKSRRRSSVGCSILRPPVTDGDNNIIPTALQFTPQKRVRFSLGGTTLAPPLPTEHAEDAEDTSPVPTTATAAAAGVTPFHHVRLPEPVRVYRRQSKRKPKSECPCTACQCYQEWRLHLIWADGRIGDACA